METMLSAGVPEYDYESHLHTLLRTLAAKGKRAEVIGLLERTRTLPGMQELFDTRTRGNV